jgi:hypothetical protein
LKDIQPDGLTVQTADVVSRRSREGVPNRADTAASPSQARVLTALLVRRDRDWHRAPIRAWAICVLASVIAVAAVGLLIIVG